MPSASICPIKMEMFLLAASRFTIPVRPTPETSANFFCDIPARSLASLKTAPRISKYSSEGVFATLRYYDLKSPVWMSVLGHI